MRMRWRKSGSMKRGRDRQEPAAISLEMRKIDADAPIHFHNLWADPEGEPQIQGIAEIQVGEHAEGHTARRLKLARIFGGLRHDGNHVAAGGEDLGIGAGERMQLKPAIIAPGPPIEADHERALIQ